MRIAFDSQIFVNQSYGGISRYIVRIAQGLLGLGQQAKIFAPLHRNSYISSLASGAVDGKRLEAFPPKTTRLIIWYNHWLARRKIADFKPNVIHETYYSKFDCAPKKCPTVVTVHDMIHELFPDQFPIRDVTSAMKQKSVERADHVICVSENTKQDLIRLFGTSHKKITVVHHGFDQLESGRSHLLDLRLNGKPFLLYVGNRAGYKNFSGMLKAVALSKRLISDFDIVAFGGGKFTDSELSLIRSLGYAPNQVSHIRGHDDLLGLYYQNAAALIYPSLYEGFGMPPLEAMANGCPVISSSTSSMPEIIGAAGNFFMPLELEDMRHSIEAVVYSDARISELRTLGKDRLKYFSWERCIHSTLNVYQALS